MQQYNQLKCGEAAYKRKALVIGMSANFWTKELNHANWENKADKKSPRLMAVRPKESSTGASFLFFLPASWHSWRNIEMHFQCPNYDVFFLSTNTITEIFYQTCRLLKGTPLIYPLKLQQRKGKYAKHKKALHNCECTNECKCIVCATRLIKKEIAHLRPEHKAKTSHPTPNKVRRPTATKFQHKIDQ